MNVVLSLGVSPDRIILANCCKRPRDIRAAAAYGVALTTFDTVSELRKLAAAHQGASAVLRIRADDPGARCPLGNKYGCEPEDVLPLLRAADELGVKVRNIHQLSVIERSDTACIRMLVFPALCIYGKAFLTAQEWDLMPIRGSGVIRWESAARHRLYFVWGILDHFLFAHGPRACNWVSGVLTHLV